MQNTSFLQQKLNVTDITYSYRENHMPLPQWILCTWEQRFNLSDYSIWRAV